MASPLWELELPTDVLVAAVEGVFIAGIAAVGVLQTACAGLAGASAW